MFAAACDGASMPWTMSVSVDSSVRTRFVPRCTGVAVSCVDIVVVVVVVVVIVVVVVVVVVVVPAKREALSTVLVFHKRQKQKT